MARMYSMKQVKIGEDASRMPHADLIDISDIKGITTAGSKGHSQTAYALLEKRSY